MAQVVKNLPANAGDLGLIPWLGVSHGGGHGNPLQYSCLENPHGQRSLVGYSPRGCKESDTTERLSPAQRASTLEIESICKQLPTCYLLQGAWSLRMGKGRQRN